MFFVVLAGLLSAAQANVVIYKGTIRLKTDIESDIGAKPPINTYLLVDFENRRVANIIFYKLNGEKKLVSGSPSDVRTATADIKGGKTVSILTNGNTSDTDGGTFSYFLLFLRGVNSTFTIRETPTVTKVNKPRVLTGSSVNVSAQDGDGRFNDATVTLAYQAKATVKANNAGKTIDQVNDEHTAELEAKGFTELN